MRADREPRAGDGTTAPACGAVRRRHRSCRLGHARAQSHGAGGCRVCPRRRFLGGDDVPRAPPGLGPSSAKDSPDVAESVFVGWHEVEHRGEVIPSAAGGYPHLCVEASRDSPDGRVTRMASPAPSPAKPGSSRGELVLVPSSRSSSVFDAEATFFLTPAPLAPSLHGWSRSRVQAAGCSRVELRLQRPP